MGRILVKGKRLNKLNAAFNNNTEDADSVSEEDEAAEAKQGEAPEAKSKVRHTHTIAVELSRWIWWVSGSVSGSAGSRQ